MDKKMDKIYGSVIIRKLYKDGLNIQEEWEKNKFEDEFEKNKFEKKRFKDDLEQVKYDLFKKEKVRNLMGSLLLCMDNPNEKDCVEKYKNDLEEVFIHNTTYEERKKVWLKLCRKTPIMSSFNAYLKKSPFSSLRKKEKK